jgi:hypothetical protein
VIVQNEQPRRSVYIQQRRTQPVSFLATFDAPVMETNCERRTSSTVAGQALLLMNNEFVLNQARLLADRVGSQSTMAPAPVLPADVLARLEPPPSPWRYGHGRFDADAQRVAEFQPLTVFTSGRWQGGAELPSNETGWVLLHAQGGHTGESPAFAAVRRWVAPTSGTLAITGHLQHPGVAGDGVRGRIVSSRAGLLGEWSVLSSAAETTVSSLAVESGETIDFVTDCRENVTTDSFTWTAQISLASDQGQTTFDSAAQFTGPAESMSLAASIPVAWRLVYAREPKPDEVQLAAEFLGNQLVFLRSLPVDPKAPVSIHDQQRQALTNLCQQLLSSNEFLYVD